MCLRDLLIRDHKYYFSLVYELVALYVYVIRIPIN